MGPNSNFEWKRCVCIVGYGEARRRLLHVWPSSIVKQYILAKMGPGFFRLTTGYMHVVAPTFEYMRCKR